MLRGGFGADPRDQNPLYWRILLGLGAERRGEEESVGRLQQTCLTFPREEGGSVGDKDAKHNVFVFFF